MGLKVGHLPEDVAISDIDADLVMVRVMSCDEPRTGDKIHWFAILLLGRT